MSEWAAKLNFYWLGIVKVVTVDDTTIYLVTHVYIQCIKLSLKS